MRRTRKTHRPKESEEEVRLKNKKNKEKNYKIRKKEVQMEKTPKRMVEEKEGNTEADQLK